MIDISKRSCWRQNTSEVYSDCGKIGHMIDTSYRKHGFPPQFKFKTQKVDSNNNNNNKQNHEGSKSQVHS